MTQCEILVPLRGDDTELQRLAAALFFHPNPSIKRVVTIGTPHRGSDYANDATRWLGKKLIKLPNSITDVGNSLIRQNPDTFRNTELLTTTTSIDSLSPESPIFPTMLRAPRAPWVLYHNIIGVISKSNWFGKEESPSDGVVDIESAMMDDVASEIMVESKHIDIHSKPRAILEVRRILVDHLRELTQYPQLAAILEVPEGWKTDSERGKVRHAFNQPRNHTLPDVVAAAAFQPWPFQEKQKKKLLAVPVLIKGSK